LSDSTDLGGRIEVLERQQALQTEALRRIVEGNWTGADGAAGLIVALVGGQAPPDFKPRPFDLP
jgi:hypothetical protein